MLLRVQPVRRERKAIAEPELSRRVTPPHPLETFPFERRRLTFLSVTFEFDEGSSFTYVRINVDSNDTAAEIATKLADAMTARRADG